MREGYLNDIIPTIYEEEFNNYLKNQYHFNFNMYLKSKSKKTSELTNEEISNEIEAYYQRFKKFISMDSKTAERVYELMNSYKKGEQ